MAPMSLLVSGLHPMDVCFNSSHNIHFKISSIMGKGLGLIGNFKGKVGNVVGYHLTDSNNKQTQGVRVYQPVVKNPRTYAQAEQRMRMSVINATYRALKDVIDRGQETKAYGNASRLAWLSRAMKTFEGPYFVKGEQPSYLAPLEISRGSLRGIDLIGNSDNLILFALPSDAVVADLTVAVFSQLLLQRDPNIQVGDQITFVGVVGTVAYVKSVIVDDTDTTIMQGCGIDDNTFHAPSSFVSGSASTGDLALVAVIVSREGSNGAHLRSTARLIAVDGTTGDDLFTTAARRAAILSYMQEGSSTDWPTEQEPVE